MTTGKTDDVVTGDLKAAGHKVIALTPAYNEKSLPDKDSLIAVWNRATALMRAGKVYAAYTPGFGGIAEAIFKMSIGNGFGFTFDDSLTLDELFGYSYGSILLEVDSDVAEGKTVGTVGGNGYTFRGRNAVWEELSALYENRLESVFPMHPANQPAAKIEAFSFPASPASRPAPYVKCARPKVLIPVFPGTNCEFDSAKAFRDAGAEPEIFVINNLTQKGIADSVSTFAARVKRASVSVRKSGCVPGLGAAVARLSRSSR